MASDLHGKTLGSDASLCLESLKTGLVGIGLILDIKKRGHLGNVHRFHSADTIWFDALPAKAWILFYFSASASRVAGLGFAQVKIAFASAIERKDMIVKVRLHDEKEAKIMVELIRSAL